MLTAMLAVKNILGEQHDLWNVNVERSYHEEFTVGEAKQKQNAVRQPSMTKNLQGMVRAKMERQFLHLSHPKLAHFYKTHEYMSSLVSVVIPAYNAEAFIEQTLILSCDKPIRILRFWLLMMDRAIVQQKL
jgi:hypothetical protein